MYSSPYYNKYNYIKITFIPQKIPTERKFLAKIKNIKKLHKYDRLTSLTQKHNMNLQEKETS